MRVCAEGSLRVRCTRSGLRRGAQVMKLLKWGADYFQTQSLDPAVWIAAIGGAYGRLCSEAPALFISIALTVFVMVALAILFEEDFAKWRRVRPSRTPSETSKNQSATSKEHSEFPSFRTVGPHESWKPKD